MKAPILLSALLVPLAMAAPPPGILNTQGRIAVSGVNYDGTGHFKFALVDNGATETFWTNDATNTGAPGGEPSTAVPVTVTKGHYSLGLGDTTLANMADAVPASLFEGNDQVYFRTWFATKPGGPFEQLAPDRRLTSGGYALHAAKAEGVADGGVTTAMLAAGSVNSDKLATGAVTNASFAPGINLDDADSDPGNELQAITRAGSDLTLSAGGGTVSINDADSNAANELQSLSLGGDTLTLSGGNSVGLGQYLRGNVSDSYTSGTLTFAPGTVVNVNGSLSIGADSGTDNDSILFDFSNESLAWINVANRFELSDDLTVFGGLQVGNNTATGYNRMGAGVTGHSLGTPDDLLITDDLEVEGTIFADGDIEVGARLYLAGQIRMNNADADQAIYFYDDGSQTNESLYWDDADDLFRFSNDLEVQGVIYGVGLIELGTSGDGFDDIIRFNGGSESLIWDESLAEFRLTDGLRITLGQLNVGWTQQNYSYFSASPPSPTSGDITSSDDVYIRRDLEVAETIYGVLSPPSDRNIKDGFEPVECTEILAKVVTLPITTWRYKDRHGEGEEAPRHIGAMAQDFHAAFGVGGSDKHITTIDADGVTLAAIQGLNAKLEAENTALRARLDQLEEAVRILTALNTEN